MFTHVVIGGTFDHIHKGHLSLLTKAFTGGEKVTIGLTSDHYVSRIRDHVSRIKPYTQRKKQLEEWLKKQNFLKRSTIVSIDDSYGPSITDRTYDAIVVSEETEKGAKKINTLRVQNGLPKLALLVVPMVPAQDTIRISSTRIRNGEIDHEGNLILPVTLRKTLTKPIGTLIPDGSSFQVSSSLCIIAVGDTTTAALLSQGIVPTLAIIDFQARRQEFDWKKSVWDTLVFGRSVSYFTSGPGFITKKVMRALEQWSKNPKKSLFIIDGEEDLLVLPAILYAPLGSIVYYGQPEQGIIEVVVTQEKKRDVQQLLSHFIAHT